MTILSARKTTIVTSGLASTHRQQLHPQPVIKRDIDIWVPTAISQSKYSSHRTAGETEAQCINEEGPKGTQKSSYESLGRREREVRLEPAGC